MRRASAWAAKREKYLSMAFKLPVVGGAIAAVAHLAFRRRFVPALLDLHDILDDSPLRGRYWVWSGLLLGWAREGALLKHDRDADLALMLDDVPLLESLVPRLRSAGFEPRARFRSNDGTTRILRFIRDGLQFEFFSFERIDDELVYYTFGWPPDNLFQNEARIADQPLKEFDFLGRTWSCHEDVDSELEAMYGDWRTPERRWHYMDDDLALTRRESWVYPDTAWEP